MNFSRQISRAEQLAKEYGSLVIPPRQPQTSAEKLWLPKEKPQQFLLEFFAYQTVHIIPDP